MHSVSWSNSLKFASVFIIGITVGAFSKPLWKEAVIVINARTYAQLVHACDTAMKSHLIAKQQLVLRPSEIAVTELKAAELGLLDCQPYDLKRKKLLRWGLSDNDLSELALKAIEANAGSLKKVVEVHEFQY